jgi:clan AA aspartic protease
MALTHIEARIANPARPRRSLRLRFLVDSGAVYSVVPARTLEKLGVKPHSRRKFILADGSEIIRRMGDAAFRLDGRPGASPVIFGEEGDSVLIGAVTLESLGVILDPLRRELRPLPMVLAPAR